MRARYLLGLALSLVVFLLNIGAATAAPTDFDTTFSGDGKMIDSTIFNEYSISKVAVDGDGKIITVGVDDASQDWLVMRFNSDGTPDNTFDTDGKVVIPLASATGYAVDVAIVAATNRIVVTGRVVPTSGARQFGVVRLDTNGSIHSTFNGGAVKIFEIDDAASGENADPAAVALDGAKIVVGGTAHDSVGGTDDFAVARLENDGDLDPTFDGDGTGLKSMTAGAADILSDVHVDGSSRIVMTGTTSDPGNPSRRVFVAARYSSTGSPDLTFGSSGTSKEYATSTTGFNSALTVTSSGKFVMVGYTSISPIACMVVQLDANGVIDTSFSTDGYQFVDFANGFDYCYGVDTDSSGNVVISGESRTSNFVGDAAIGRLTPSGEPDTTFDPDGKVLHNLGAGKDNYWDVTVQGDDKIVAGGFVDSNGAAPNGVIVSRLNGGSGGFTPPVKPSPLALDTTFDGDGKVTSDFSSGRVDNVNGVDTFSDGSILVSGSREFQFSPSPLVYLPEASLAKYLPSGALDPNFGDSGFAFLNLPGSETAVFQDAVVLSDGSVMAVATYNASGSGTDVALVKFTNAGDIDTGFGGGDGIVIDDWELEDVAESIHLTSDGKFVVTGSMGNSSAKTFFATKYLSTGARDLSYGTSGRTTVVFGLASTQEAEDSDLAADDTLAIGGWLDDGPFLKSAVAVLDADGQPAADYMSGLGKLSLSFYGNDSRVDGIAFQSDGKLLLTGTATVTGHTDTDVWVGRYLKSGSRDQDAVDYVGFSGDGLAIVPIDSEDDSGSSIVLDDVSGEITVGAVANYGTDTDFAFARFDQNGEPDPDFDADGFGSTSIGTGNDVIGKMTLDPSRRVVAAGTSAVASITDVAVARLIGPFIPPPPTPEPPPAVAPVALGATSRLSTPRHKRKYTAKRFKTLKGTTAPLDLAQPVTKVEVAIRKSESGRCKWLTSTKAKFRVSKQKNKKCPNLTFLKVSGTTSWSLKLRKTLPAGKYEVHVRATTSSGVVESTFSTKSNRATFTLK